MKYIVEMEGRAVYASKNYTNVRRVAWRMIHADPHKEVIVQLMGFIVGI